MNNAFLISFAEHLVFESKANFKMWKTYHTKNANAEYLYKFLSFDNLKLFLTTGSIWFSKANLFGDQMECVRLKDLITEKPNYEEIEKRKQRFLISCWHLADRESLVLWDTYSDTIDKRRTTAIRFRKEDLISLMDEFEIRNYQNLFNGVKFVHGKVLYKTMIGLDLELLLKNAVKQPEFRKEAAFQYENEYRFVIEYPHEYKKEGYAYGIYKSEKHNAEGLPFNIIINPLLKSELYLSIKKQIECSEFEKHLIQSELAKWLKPELW